MRVLVTDGQERAALAAARSLIAAGFEVDVAAGQRYSLAGVSRGVCPIRLDADPLTDPPRFVALVGKLVRDRGIDVVLPVTDPSVEALLEHRAVLSDRLVLPLPGLDAYQVASNKLETLLLAGGAGLGLPETVVLASPADLGRVPSADFYPAVVKPYRSVVPRAGNGAGRQKVGVWFVDGPDSCRRAIAALPETAYPLLLQRRVRGPGEGLFLLRWDDRTLAAFAHRRLREKPPDGGVSVYRESIAADPALVAAGERLLGAIGWNGVAMIECKREAATGRLVFLEINGRLWGSLQLALDAGVDFPALLVRCALGQPVEPVTGYRIGVRSRWFWGDLDHLYLRLRHGPGRFPAIGDFLRHHPRQDREEIWRWRDPAPFIVETLGRLGMLS